MHPRPDIFTARYLESQRHRVQPWIIQLNQSIGLISTIPVFDEFKPRVKEIPWGFDLFPKPQSQWIANLWLAFLILATTIHWYCDSQNFVSPFVVSNDLLRNVNHPWEWLRIIGALGGHADFSHLGWNAPILWFFAWILTAYFGPSFGLFWPLVIGIISNLITIYFYDSAVGLLGASGMIYGMIALWLGLYIQFDRQGRWQLRTMRSLGFALLILFPKSYDIYVSNLAHASGFLAGAILSVLLRPVAMKSAPVFHDAYYLKP
jgi:membrane associated rhomboid family serine protease